MLSLPDFQIRSRSKMTIMRVLGIERDSEEQIQGNEVHCIKIELELDERGDCEQYGMKNLGRYTISPQKLAPKSITLFRVICEKSQTQPAAAHPLFASGIITFDPYARRAHAPLLNVVGGRSTCQCVNDGISEPRH